MTNQTFIGIDVSKQFLDVYIHPVGQHMRYPNTTAGRRALMHRIGAPHNIMLVCFEASGGYERALRQTLAQNGYCHACVQPARVHHYMKAQGEKAKTDALDAKALALFAASGMANPSHVPDQTLQDLRDMTRTLAFIRGKKKTLKNQIEKTPHNAMLKRLHILLGAMDEQETALLQDIKIHVQTHEPLDTLIQCLQTTPGIGFYSACVIAAELPELGICSKNQIAALAGVAPFTRQSGKWVGKSSIKGGRHHARKALYMAALTASRHNKVFKKTYDNLRHKGKPFKVALTAIMRKMIVALNAMVKHNNAWNEIYS